MNNRILGTIAMVCAPALLVEGLLLQGRENALITGIASMVFTLSMLWMLVVGVTVVVAKQLHGWKRFVPIFCPLWLLIAIAGSAAFGDVGGFLGLGFAAILWALLGYIVRDSREPVGATPKPAVR